MKSLAKLEFVVLDVFGNTYLYWVLDAKLHFNVNGLKDIIDPKIPVVEQMSKQLHSYALHQWRPKIKISHYEKSTHTLD